MSWHTLALAAQADHTRIWCRRDHSDTAHAMDVDRGAGVGVPIFDKMLANANHYQLQSPLQRYHTSRRMIMQVTDRKHFSLTSLAAASAIGLMLTLNQPALATGKATCDAGPQTGWQSQEQLGSMLTAKGWQIRRIKIDGGCYEVYAMNERGERVEAYFHPRTFAPVPTGSKDFKG
jgi:hypothetical protein